MLQQNPAQLRLIQLELQNAKRYADDLHYQLKQMALPAKDEALDSDGGQKEGKEKQEPLVLGDGRLGLSDKGGVILNNSEQRKAKQARAAQLRRANLLMASLLVLYFGLLIAGLVTILTLTTSASDDSMHQQIENIANTGRVAIEHEIDGLLKVPLKVTEIMRRGVLRGDMPYGQASDVTRFDELWAGVFDVFNATPLMHAYIALDDGTLHGASKGRFGQAMHQVFDRSPSANSSAPINVYNFTGQRSQALASCSQDQGLDPTTRPWFTHAVNSYHLSNNVSSTVWSSVYVDSLTLEPCITASVAMQLPTTAGAQALRIAVVGVDLELRALSIELQTMKIDAFGEKSEASIVLFEEDGRLLATTGGCADADTDFSSQCDHCGCRGIASCVGSTRPLVQSDSLGLSETVPKTVPKAITVLLAANDEAGLPKLPSSDAGTFAGIPNKTAITILTNPEAIVSIFRVTNSSFAACDIEPTPLPRWIGLLAVPQAEWFAFKEHANVFTVVLFLFTWAVSAVIIVSKLAGREHVQGHATFRLLVGLQDETNWTLLVVLLQSVLLFGGSYVYWYTSAGSAITVLVDLQVSQITRLAKRKVQSFLTSPRQLLLMTELFFAVGSLPLQHGVSPAMDHLMLDQARVFPESAWFVAALNDTLPTDRCSNKPSCSSIGSMVGVWDSQQGGTSDDGETCSNKFIAAIDNSTDWGYSKFYVTGDQRNVSKLWSRAPDYRMKLRPWFTPDATKFQWADIYQFDTGEIGTTLTKGFENLSKVGGTWASDYSLDGIGVFLNTLKQTGLSLIYIVERNKKVFGDVQDNRQYHGTQLESGIAQSAACCCLRCQLHSAWVVGSAEPLAYSPCSSDFGIDFNGSSFPCSFSEFNTESSECRLMHNKGTSRDGRKTLGWTACTPFSLASDGYLFDTGALVATSFGLHGERSTPGGQGRVFARSCSSNVVRVVDSHLRKRFRGAFVDAVDWTGTVGHGTAEGPLQVSTASIANTTGIDDKLDWVQVVVFDSSVFFKPFQTAITQATVLVFGVMLLAIVVIVTGIDIVAAIFKRNEAMVSQVTDSAAMVARIVALFKSQGHELPAEQARRIADGLAGAVFDTVNQHELYPGAEASVVLRQLPRCSKDVEHLIEALESFPDHRGRIRFFARLSAIATGIYDSTTKGCDELNEPERVVVQRQGVREAGYHVFRKLTETLVQRVRPEGAGFLDLARRAINSDTELACICWRLMCLIPPGPKEVIWTPRQVRDEICELYRGASDVNARRRLVRALLPLESSNLVSLLSEMYLKEKFLPDGKEMLRKFNTLIKFANEQNVANKRDRIDERSDSDRVELLVKKQGEALVMYNLALRMLNVGGTGVKLQRLLHVCTLGEAGLATKLFWLTERPKYRLAVWVIVVLLCLVAFLEAPVVDMEARCAHVSNLDQESATDGYFESKLAVEGMLLIILLLVELGEAWCSWTTSDVRDFDNLVGRALLRWCEGSWRVFAHRAFVFILFADWLVQSTTRYQIGSTTLPTLLPVTCVLRPFVALLRNKHAAMSASAFIRTMWYAADVFQFLAAVLFVAAIIGVALVGQDFYGANNQYGNVVQSLVATFTFTTGAENYVDLVHPPLKDTLSGEGGNFFYLVYFIPLAVMGVFLTIALVIAVFERHFTQYVQDESRNQMRQRRLATLACFTAIDGDFSKTLSMSEVIPLFEGSWGQQLMGSSGSEIELSYLQFVALVEQATLVGRVLKPWSVPRDPSKVEGTPGRPVRRVTIGSFLSRKKKGYACKVRKSALERLGLVLSAVNVWTLALLGLFEEHHSLVDVISITIIGLFAAEVALRVWAVSGSVRAFWFCPTAVFVQTKNRYDACLAIISVAGLVVLAAEGINPVGTALGSSARVPLVIPLLRVFSNIRVIRPLFFGLVRILPRFSDVLSLVVLIFYVWAAFGVFLFAGKMSYMGGAATPSIANFNSFLGAMTTLFQMLVGASWHQVMEEARATTSELAVWYFVLWVVICTVLISNLGTWCCLPPRTVHLRKH
jgi:hypothetical protein